MRIVADIKCYHCGHISGQVEGERDKQLVLDTFKPRQGYQGKPPAAGERIRCERCRGPVYLEDIRPAPAPGEPVYLPTAATRKRSKASRAKTKAA